MRERHFSLHMIQKINAADPESRNRFLRWMFAAIPDKIENHTIIRILEILRRAQRRKKKDYSIHLQENQRRLTAHLGEIRKKNGLIEDQNRYTDLAFGEVTMQFSGCEIFAVFNAMADLRQEPPESLVPMIDRFERDGMLLGGGLGTSPPALQDYLREHGFQTLFTTKETMFEHMAKTCRGLILTMYNDRHDVSKAVHTVYISRQQDSYIAHNVYCNGSVVGPYPSVTQLIASLNGGRSKGISMIGIL